MKLSFKAAVGKNTAAVQVGGRGEGGKGGGGKGREGRFRVI
jgi:hypothetical protein